MVQELLDNERKKLQPKSEDDESPFQRVAPKPRGTSGPLPRAPATPLRTEFQEQRSQYMQAPPWGGYYGAPQIVIQSGALDSPVKRALGINTGFGGGSSQELEMEEGPPLEEWLEELDIKFGKGSTPYGDLWAALRKEGFENVQDVYLCSIPDLARSAQCSEVIARRVHAKARATLGIKN